ncbi:hypothetical protein CYMTET_20891 [Cymbomonas tetramitiformis]|uniref:Uncharacterized protein n=1 Tax=Cymbomonas tetramitiformis TaxID=36881 RepID=A0AAE0G4F5_9CHLO|nr:hypothetical protein CYMTET_20891 [Cymbomonas tetramitiformis]
MDHQFHPLQASGTGHTGEPFPAGPDMPEGQLTALAMPLTSPEYIVHQRVQREAYGSVDPYATTQPRLSTYFIVEALHRLSPQPFPEECTQRPRRMHHRASRRMLRPTPKHGHGLCTVSPELTFTPFPPVWSSAQQRAAVLRDPASLAHQPGAREHALGSEGLASGTEGGIGQIHQPQNSVPQTSSIPEGLEVYNAHTSEGGDHAGQEAGTAATAATEVAEDAEDVPRRRGEVAEIVEAAITADRERTSEEDRQLRADARLIREAQSAAYKAELMVLSTRLKEAEAELSTLRPQLTAAPQSHAGDAGVEVLVATVDCHSLWVVPDGVPAGTPVVAHLPYAYHEEGLMQAALRALSIIRLDPESIAAAHGCFPQLRPLTAPQVPTYVLLKMDKSVADAALSAAASQGRARVTVDWRLLPYYVSVADAFPETVSAAYHFPGLQAWAQKPAWHLGS